MGGHSAASCFYMHKGAGTATTVPRNENGCEANEKTPIVECRDELQKLLGKA